METEAAEGAAIAGKRYLIEADPSLARTAIEADIPGFAVREIVVEHQGMDNHTFLVNDEWIFRFPRDEDYRAEQELWVLNAVRDRTTLPVPVVEHVGVSTAFVAYRRVPGDLLVHHWDALSEAEQDYVLAQIAEFMEEVHTNVDPAEAQANGIGTMTFWTECIPIVEAYLERGGGSDDWRPFAEGCVERFRRYVVDPGEVAVLHADLHGHNVLVDPETKRAVGVIDFGDVIVGDLHADFHPICWVGLPELDRLARHYERRRGVSLNRTRIKDYSAMDLLDVMAESLLAGQPEEEHCAQRLCRYAEMERHGLW